MRSMMWLVLLSACKSGVVCGDGTEEEDGVCVPVTPPDVIDTDDPVDTDTDPVDTDTDDPVDTDTDTDAGPTWVEEPIAHVREVDLLLVVDDSALMLEEHGALVLALPYLFQSLDRQAVDYHLGIVRGDVSAGTPGALAGVPRFVTPTDPSPLASLTATVEGLGDYGSGSCESGLYASLQALTQPLVGTHNSGFLRTNAGLVLLTVTNEDDGGALVCGYLDSAPDAWVPWFTGLKGDPSRTHLAVIGGFLDDHITAGTCTGATGTADPAVVYAEAGALLPSSTFSVCGDDWTGFLTDLGVSAAVTSGTALALAEAPVVDSGDFDSDGDTAEYAISMTVDEGFGPVDVQPAHAATPHPRWPWSFDPTTGTVTFEGEWPPRSAVVSVRYATSAGSP